MSKNLMKDQLLKKLLLLSIGLLLFFFGNGNVHYAFATWLFPVFLLYASRTTKPVISYALIPILLGICSHFSFWKFIPSRPNEILYYVPFLLGTLYGFVFLIDRFLYPKINGFIASLIFPLAYTSLDYLVNLLSPLGTTGILGYSQIEFLSFSQLASLTGMWGMTFMITWFGSIAVWCLFNFQTRKKQIKNGILIYTSIFLSIIIYGEIRLGLNNELEKVKISGIHTNEKSEDFELWGKLRNKDTIGFEKLSNQQIQKLIDKTISESEKGAKIIVWSEISLQILKKDQDSLVNIFKSLANQNDIYLLTNPFVINVKGKKSENKIMLFSPDGELELEHYKYGGNFLEQTREGSKRLSKIETQYGNLSGLICWDADFPSIVKQIHNLKTDILLIPASDWKEIAPLHTIIAIYRGIENGCSVVRQTRNGLSIMTDQKGNTISSMNHFENKDWLMTGEVPKKRIWTLYPIIGDLFGWLAFLGLGILTFLALKNTAPNNTYSK